MHLQPSLEAYFQADRSHQKGAPLQAFTPDAIVKDEGRSHVGHQAIDAWWRDVKTKYQSVAEPLQVNENGNTLEVRAKVTGQFPGSPVTLTFAFQLEDQRIAVLEIGS